MENALIYIEITSLNASFLGVQTTVEPLEIIQSFPEILQKILKFIPDTSP